MLDLYKDFVVARAAADAARRGAPLVESADPVTERVLRSYRFTNVFRVADWGSQYVVRALVEGRPLEDVLPSLVLYRLTNITPPWEFYESFVGRPPSHEDLVDGTFLYVMKWEWGKAMFGTAYNTHVGRGGKGSDKLEFFTQVAAMVTPEFTREFVAAAPARRHQLLMTLPRIGDFLAMQVLTDYGYAGDDCEDTYIVPGPGALRGAALLEADDPVSLIWSLRDMWRDDPAAPLLPNGLPPSLMDVQNTLCEFQKFVRYYRGGQGHRFTVKHPDLPPLTLPKNWRTR